MSDNKKQGKSRKLKTEAQLGRRKKRRGMCLADRPCLEPNPLALISERVRFLQLCLRIVRSVPCEYSIRSPKICTPWLDG